MESSSSSENYSYSYSSEDTSALSWIDKFHRNNYYSYMCKVDLEFIRDSFNLYGLSTGCRLYRPAMNLLLESDESDSDSSIEEYNEGELEDTTFYLYGMIHARYILTYDGLEDMNEKYIQGDFGCCTRVYCNNQHLLPIGLSDTPSEDTVKLFCPCCKEVYNPPPMFGGIDGAFFGTTFAHFFLLQYPDYLASPAKLYEPAIFGYKIHKDSPYYKISKERQKKITNE